LTIRLAHHLFTPL